MGPADRALRWERAEKAGVTANTVARIENGADAKQSTMDALQRVLEAASVEFTNGEQPGVRITKAAATHSADASASNPRAVAKAGRRKTLKGPRRNDSWGGETIVRHEPSAIRGNVIRRGPPIRHDTFQNSGLSAMGTAACFPWKYPFGFSAQTISGHSPNGRQ
jgi:transcriptional regulator with XRE-family HTH domain